MSGRFSTHMLRRTCLIKIMLSLLVVGLIVSPGQWNNKAEAGSQFVQDSFTNDYGTRDFKLYIPSGYKGQHVPLIVMLHGCTQNPDDFAAGTKMNAIAERETFLVVYPEQPSTANTSKCWNWFEPAHQERSKGEPSLIAGITQKVIANYRVDANQVHIAGMSAGGAMTVIMGATYPDVYAAIGISAGLEYQAANDLVSALAAQETGGPDPDRQGGLAFLSSGQASRIVPTIVFHGQNDLTVNVINGHQIISQWAQTNDYADDGTDNDSIVDKAGSIVQGQVTDGYAYTKSIYNSAKGTALMEKWIVETMTHKWSGGSMDGSYTDPKGPDASEEMIRFFKEHPKNKS
jgi:poly(hydroxyalkanoate) depolymerase family esterase